MRLRLLKLIKSPIVRGFTLLELLIVLAIIGILLTLGFYKYQSVQEATYDVRAQAIVRSVYHAGEAQITVSLSTYGTDNQDLLQGLINSTGNGQGGKFNIQALDPTALFATNSKGNKNPENIFAGRERDEESANGVQFSACNQSQSGRWFCWRGHSKSNLLTKAEVVQSYQLAVGTGGAARSWGGSLPSAYCHLAGTQTPPGRGCSETQDLCPNIAGKQSIVPYGFIFDATGNCVAPSAGIDRCSNIPGLQAEVPAGYRQEDNGTCSALTDPGDLCSNIAGVQLTVPASLVRNAFNECTETTTDPLPCLNSCGGGGDPSAGTDVCPNIPGIQTSVPSGYVLNSSKQCVPIPAPPSVIISSPANSSTTQNPDVTLTFVLSGGAADTVECKVDAGSYTACTSPTNYIDMSVATHTITVRVVNAGGVGTNSVSFTITTGGHTHGPIPGEAAGGLDLTPIMYTTAPTAGVAAGGWLNNDGNVILNIHSVVANGTGEKTLTNFSGSIAGQVNKGATQLAYAPDHRHVAYRIRPIGWFGVMNAWDGSQQYRTADTDYNRASLQFRSDNISVVYNSSNFGDTKIQGLMPITHQIVSDTLVQNILGCSSGDIDNTDTFTVCQFVNGGGFKIARVNLNGTGNTVLTNVSACSYPVAAAGYLFCEGGGKLLRGSDSSLNATLTPIYDGAGTTATAREAVGTNSSQGHSWAVSPDGTKLAFVTKGVYTTTGTMTRKLEIMNIDGTNRGTLVTNTGGLLMGNLAWAPNGNHIAYTCGPDELNWDICLTDNSPVVADATPILAYDIPTGISIGEMAWNSGNFAD